MITIASGTSYAATLQVGPGKAYTTIAGAVSAASPGDTIQVDGGFKYPAGTDITKSLTLVGIVNGAGAKPVIDATGTGGNGLMVHASGVTIDGFRVESASANNMAGINIYGPDCLVRNVDASGNYYGVFSHSNNTTITGCSATGSGLTGFEFMGAPWGKVLDSSASSNIRGVEFDNTAPHGTVSNCQLTNNAIGVYGMQGSFYLSISGDSITVKPSGYGILLQFMNDTSISGCTLVSPGSGSTAINVDTGNRISVTGCSLTSSALNSNLYLRNCNDSTVTNVNIKGCFPVPNSGLYLATCDNVTVSGGKFTDCWSGIQLATNSRNIRLIGVNSSCNYYGLNIQAANDSVIAQSIFSGNNVTSVYMLNCKNDMFAENSFINCPVPRMGYSTDIIWNTVTPMPYTFMGIGRTGYLGNYWSDYTGVDNDANGIGDTPFVTGVVSDPYVSLTDYYPLIHEWSGSGVTGASVAQSTPVGSYSPSGTIDMGSMYSHGSTVTTATPTATATPTSTPVPTQAATPTATQVATPAPTQAATPAATPTATPVPTPTPDQGNGGLGGNVLYIVLGLLVLVVVAGVAVYYLFFRK